MTDSDADARVEPGADPDPAAGEKTACAHTDYRRSPAATPEDLPATGADATGLERRVWDALAEVEDPEMPVSVVDLGLVYGVDVTDGAATVRMTLTYTGCPAREFLLADVERAAAAVEGVETAAAELVWSPPWSVDMVTERGRERLREFGVGI